MISKSRFKDKKKITTKKLGPVFDSDMSYCYNNFIIKDELYNLVGTSTPDKTYLAKDSIDEIKNAITGKRYYITREVMYNNFSNGNVEAFGEINAFKRISIKK